MNDQDFFGPGATFHHVGMAVRSVADHCEPDEITIDETQRVRLAFTQINGLTVELLEPLHVGSPIDKSLKNGTKLLHLCYEVPDLERAVEACRKHGLHRMSTPVSATAFDERRIVWVYSRSYGLFELVERASE